MGSSHIVFLFAVKKVAGHMFAHLKIKYLCKNHSWILSSILIVQPKPRHDWISKQPRWNNHCEHIFQVKIESTLFFSLFLSFWALCQGLLGDSWNPLRNSYVPAAAMWGATEATVPSLSDSWTQTELQQEDATLKASGCRESLKPLAGHMVSKPVGRVKLSRGCASLFQEPELSIVVEVQEEPMPIWSWKVEICMTMKAESWWILTLWRKFMPHLVTCTFRTVSLPLWLMRGLSGGWAWATQDH